MKTYRYKVTYEDTCENTLYDMVTAPHCADAAAMVESDTRFVVNVERVAEVIEKTSDGYSREEFDHLMSYAEAELINGDIRLTGAFCTEALEAIIYVVKNEPEWITL